MSVINAFTAKLVRLSESERIAYFIGPTLSNGCSFPFTFYCKTGSVALFFDFKNDKVIVVHKRSPDAFDCILMRFWLGDNLPILSANYFVSQKDLITNISDDFKEKYAAYLLDNIINS